MGIINRGFAGKESNQDHRLPPGQFVASDFPVLTYGPTPQIDLDSWQLKITGLVDKEMTWGWKEFMALPQTTLKTNIHCVTRWSKFDTIWRGVSLDYLFEQAGVKPEAKFLISSCYGGYTSNLPLSDVTGGQALIAHEFDGKPLPAEHGGPARLFVPHLYFWKSSKWVNELKLVAQDDPGFWERNGYNDHGDPWKEERYSGD